MDKIFEIIDALTPIFGPEGAIVLKVVVAFVASYYLFIGIPALVIYGIASILVWRHC